MKTLELTLEEPYIDYRKPFDHTTLSQTRLPTSPSNFSYLRTVDPEKYFRKGAVKVYIEGELENGITKKLGCLDIRDSYNEPIGDLDDQSAFLVTFPYDRIDGSPEKSFRRAVEALDAGVLTTDAFNKFYSLMANSLITKNLISYEAICKYANDTLKNELFVKRLAYQRDFKPGQIIILLTEEPHQKQKIHKKPILSNQWYNDFVDTYAKYLNHKHPTDPYVLLGFAALVPHILVKEKKVLSDRKSKFMINLLIKAAKQELSCRRIEKQFDEFSNYLRWTAYWTTDEKQATKLMDYSDQMIELVVI